MTMQFWTYRHRRHVIIIIPKLSLGKGVGQEVQAK